MTQTDLEIPGAKWWKVDFHTHTPASTDWRGGDATAEEWLRAQMEAGVDCVMVTDHNSGAWIDELKITYARMSETGGAGYRRLFLFPGIEISVGGIHVLGIFDCDRTSADLDMLLGKAGFNGTKGDSGCVATRSVLDVLNAIEEHGGMAIAAHADKAKGLLQTDEGAKAAVDAGTLKMVLAEGKLAAAEIIDIDSRRPQVYLESGVRLPAVLGSDSHKLDSTRENRQKFTWVKMETPTLNGIRLALLEGEASSIRRGDDAHFDPRRLPAPRIESIEIENARRMGKGQPAHLAFSPWLNALVGGRGTGKSSVVHFLRLVLGRGHELSANSEPKRIFDQFIRQPKDRKDDAGALAYDKSAGTKISVTLSSASGRYRLIWEQRLLSTRVEVEEDGAWSATQSQDTSADRFPVRIVSQGQIASLTEGDRTALMKVIDDAAGILRLKESLAGRKQRYLAVRARSRDLETRVKARAQVQGVLEDVSRKLASFEEHQHAEVLRTYQFRSRQGREIDRQLTSARSDADKIAALAQEIAAEDPPENLFDSARPEDLQAAELVSRLRTAVERASTAVRAAGEELREAAERERNGLASNPWSEANLHAATEYTRLSEALRQQGVTNPGEYGALVQRRHEAEAELARLDAIEQEKEVAEAEARDALARVREARADISAARRQYLERSLAANKFVRIQLQQSGRKAGVVEAEFRVLIGAPDRFDESIYDEDGDGGLIADLVRDLPGDEFATEEFERRLDELRGRVRRAAEGAGDFGGHFNNFLQREAEKHPDFADRIALWSPEDWLLVEYSPKGDGRNWLPIDQASAGQSAAAMLAFLLAHGSDPLILDQPEDDLDNHLIYELIVKQMKENKSGRQIIVITHNANVVVNGDAEMVHALDFVSGQCRVKYSGSLQVPEVRNEVCDVMEGGREAFRLRYRRLSGEPAGV